MLLRLIPVFLLMVAATVLVHGKVFQKPYILELTGSCSPGEMSIEYFITGEFGGYGSFVKTDSRFAMYEIPMVREGKPARTLKVIVRGPRCRTQTFDIPEVEKGGRVLRARLRRSRQIEYRGVIRSTENLRKSDRVLTVEYWADWKCVFFGLADCLVGPTRIDAVEIEKDGKFKVNLPDFTIDPVLTNYSAKGTFQFYIRERKGGNVLFELRTAFGDRSIPVASAYPKENDFVLETRSQ